MDWPVDPNASRNILINSAGLSVGSGLLAALTGSRKQLDGTSLGLNTAKNIGLTSFVFFGIRDWLITPSFIKYNVVTNYDKHSRSHKILDSCLSGAIGSGVWNYHLRGRAGVLPGIITAVTVCTIGQAISNEFTIQRVKYIRSKLTKPEKEQTVREPQPEITVDNNDNQNENSRSKHRWWDRFKFYRISDEDYLKKLQSKAQLTKAAILEVESQIAYIESQLSEKEVKSI